MTVLQLPPKESLSIVVNRLLRYGTCEVFPFDLSFSFMLDFAFWFKETITC